MLRKMEVYLLEIPLKEPFRISAGTSTKSTNIVIRLVNANGDEGWGEASPSHRVLNETIDTVKTTLKSLFPKIKKLECTDIEKLYEVIMEAPGSPSAKAALDFAFFDLYGKEVSKPVYKLLGGYRENIETDITIGIMEPEEQAKRALKFVSQGFHSLKIKLGINPEKDIERIRAIRDAIGYDTVIRVDANQGWDVDEAIYVINKLADYEVELVEQPIRWDDIKGLKRIKKESSLPIAADETVKTSADALRVIEADAVDIINIKLMKSRGIWGALKIASISEAAGIKNMIGCMGESRIGITAGVHAALGIRNIQIYDLDSDLLLKEDVVIEGGATIEKGIRKANSSPGFGISKMNMGMLSLLFVVK